MNLTLALTDYLAISPLLILLGGALIVLLLETFWEGKSSLYAAAVTSITLLIALYAAWQAPVSHNHLLTAWLKFDNLARAFSLFFLAVGLATTFLSAQFFRTFTASYGEYYFLLIASIFGLLLIGSAADFLTLFLGLETLSISLYILCGYMKKWEISHESALKYFLMGAMATGFFLYGIALVYGALGTTRFSALLPGYSSLESGPFTVLFLAGVALITLGLAFKAAIVPFHVWAPDVYSGAPTPVTAFMAVGTKVGAFAAFVRIFLVSLPQFDPLWNQLIALLAYPTLIYANIVALRQLQLRRFFAYSGISHAGFLLIPLAAGTDDAISALFFYLVVYAIATLGAFAVLAFLDKKSEGVTMRDISGLFSTSPWLAMTFSLCLLTLAGIPPTAGFFAKFFVFKVAFQAGYYLLVIVGLLTTILSAYYYLRMVAVMFSGVSEYETPVQLSKAWPAAAVGIASLAAITILSFYPTPLLNLLGSITS